MVGVILLLAPPSSNRAARDPQTGKQLRVVQPNIGQQDKWTPGLRRDRRATARQAVGAARRRRPRLLLWPEAAVTDPLEDARTDQHQAFANFERTRAAALLGPGDDLLTGGIALVLE